MKFVIKDKNGNRFLAQKIEDDEEELALTAEEVKEDEPVEDAEATEEEAMEFSDMITEKYPDVEVEVNEGGQPIYYYMVSVE